MTKFKKKGVLVSGLPIKAKWKGLVLGIIIFLLILNITLPQFFDALSYPANGYVSIILIILAVVISIGSYATESVVIAIAILLIVSNLWDFAIHDFSSLRTQMLFSSIIVLIFELTFGKIGIIHLVRILKNQFGVSE